MAIDDAGVVVAGASGYRKLTYVYLKLYVRFDAQLYNPVLSELKVLRAK